MFREFALTLTIAVVTSAIVSLTLTPMMCSRLAKTCRREMAVPGLAAVSRGIDRMVGFYHRTLLGCCGTSARRWSFTLATIVATVAMYNRGAERFSPLAGHRVDHRGDRGRRPTCRLPRWQNRQSGSRGRDQGRSRCHRRGVGHWCRLRQSDHQCRPSGDDAEAARRTARRHFGRGRAIENNAWASIPV